MAAPGGYRLSGEVGTRWLRPLTRVAESELSVPPPPPSGTVHLGDVASAFERGRYGPIERDMSNGSWKPGDGKPLSINGVEYAKGLGGHAPSELVVYLGGACTAFTSDVGVDGERDERMQGSAGFEVWADDDEDDDNRPLMTDAW